MQPRYYRIRDLASKPARGDKPATVGRYPVGPGTIWRWVAQGKFPAPVKLGPQTTAWPADALDAWDKSHSAGRAA